MNGPFDGPDLLVGEITAVRTFDLRSDGTLWPVFAADRRWTDGENTAVCRRHEAAGAPGCKCGFWAYGSVAALREQPAARNVAAVVSCWGRVTPGTRGLRAQHARLDAIWLSTRVAEELVAQVAATYPHAAIYRDRAQMLLEHPLSVMASYRLPDRRPFRFVAARFVLQALLGAGIVVGVLPRAAFQAHWLSQLHAQLIQLLVYLVLASAVRFVVDRGLPTARMHYSRLILSAVALLAWVSAPYASLLWQLPLRVPVVISAVRLVLNRTVRFVPTKAVVAPEPDADGATS